MKIFSVTYRIPDGKLCSEMLAARSEFEARHLILFGNAGAEIVGIGESESAEIVSEIEHGGITYPIHLIVFNTPDGITANATSAVIGREIVGRCTATGTPVYRSTGKTIYEEGEEIDLGPIALRKANEALCALVPVLHS